MAELKVRYTYRLRLSRASERELMSEWDRCRFVWNQCVARSKELRAAGEQCGPALLEKELTALRSEKPWLKEGSPVAQQQSIRDFGAARSKAVKDITTRVPMTQRRGFPKFKKKDLALPSLNYTRRGFSLKDGRLHLAGGIELGVVWSRELPSIPTSVQISRVASGKWWASFVTKTCAEALPYLNRSIGIDWGVTETATRTDPDYDLPHPLYGETTAAKLARYQRMMARRKKPKGKPKSKRYQKAQLQTAKVYAKVARKRKDEVRKWAKNVISNHDQIAVEDFKPKFLAGVSWLAPDYLRFSQASSGICTPVM